MLDFIDERLNDKDAQATALACGDPIFDFVHGFDLIGRKVDAGVILNDDFKAILETRDNDHDFHLERLRGISVLDDIGAGFAHGHLDFGDIFVAKTALFGGTHDGVPNLWERAGRAFDAHLLVP